MHLTQLIRPLFVRTAHRRMEAADRADCAQQRVLARLLYAGARTAYGRRFGIEASMSYADYARRVPLVSYEELRPDIEAMIGGQPDVLWPGVVRRYAQSSGTTGGKSKYVPVTAESLHLMHYAGAAAALSFYLLNNPGSHIFSGRSFILGGSFANELHLDDRRVRVGDLSASLIECVNPMVELVRVPSRKVALMADWESKLPALTEAALRADVTNISGVPSWFLTVLRSILARAGASSVNDVWPRLEVFFHGGISFAPYRAEYDSIIDPQRMHYVETYNASEGFFATQDTPDSHDGMLLMADCGVFYEFMPVGADGDSDRLVPMWELERGAVYELVITACNGLWRYRIGDTVRVVSTSPVRIEVAGRTRSFINAFGEELMVWNADRALTAACRATGATVADYTAAPVYASGRNHGHHQWLVEFTAPPTDMEQFGRLLDHNLRSENSDYDAKRSKDIFLDPPEIVVARPRLFDDWLAMTGRRGGQRKVPRLSNDRTIIESMLRLNHTNAKQTNFRNI